MFLIHLRMVFSSYKLAISELFNIPADRISKINASGIENSGIFSYEDKIFKVTVSKNEYKAALRLIGKDFKNVVKVFGAEKCLTKLPKEANTWTSYIICEEKLFREKKSNVYDELDLNSLFNDTNNRLPYYVDVMNGINELLSVGIKHNDLHCMNIMKDKAGNFKIFDFGYATICRKYQKTNYRIELIQTAYE